MKKLISLALCLMSIMVILCSCKPDAPVASSTPAENESSVTESETSSVDYSENETSSIKEKEDKDSFYSEYRCSPNGNVFLDCMKNGKTF